MLKIVTACALVLCALAQDNPDSCVELKRLGAGMKKHRNEIKRLGKEFKNADGTVESKYELYKTSCMEIRTNVIAITTRDDMPICHDANDSNDSSPEVDDVKINKTRTAEQTFNFMCNLKENEYQGYVKLAIRKTVPKPSDCYELTTRYFNNDREYLYDFCGPKKPEMMTCLKNTFVGHDDAYAYLDAVVSNFRGILCALEIDEKTYLNEFRRLEFDIHKYVTKDLMKS